MMHYRTCLFCLVCLASAAISGCGYPTAQPGNQRLISSLRTALSARNANWLQQNVDTIETRRAEGQMPDAEYEAFQSIIAQAQAGQWVEAERASIAFQKAQRPTREQVERVTLPEK